MPQKYKLSYFPITGLGEGIRFLLSYGNIEFEDERIAFDDWPKRKTTMPFGKMPVLEIDGKKIHQSNAICRYLAKQMNLAGKDEWESLHIDIVMDTLTDLRQHFVGYYFETEEATRAAKHKTLINETVPYFFSRFDKIAEENGGYFVGGRLSWADLNFVGVVDYLSKRLEMDMYKGYPNLMLLRENVVNIPQIKAWIQKRPEDVIFTFKTK